MITAIVTYKSRLSGFFVTYPDIFYVEFTGKGSGLFWSKWKLIEDELCEEREENIERIDKKLEKLNSKKFKFYEFSKRSQNRSAIWDLTEKLDKHYEESKNKFKLYYEVEKFLEENDFYLDSDIDDKRVWKLLPNKELFKEIE